MPHDMPREVVVKWHANKLELSGLPKATTSGLRHPHRFENSFENVESFRKSHFAIASTVWESGQGIAQGIVHKATNIINSAFWTPPKTRSNHWLSNESQME
jgi:hypothetical protein